MPHTTAVTCDPSSRMSFLPIRRPARLNHAVFGRQILEAPSHIYTRTDAPFNPFFRSPWPAASYCLLGLGVKGVEYALLSLGFSTVCTLRWLVSSSGCREIYGWLAAGPKIRDCENSRSDADKRCERLVVRRVKAINRLRYNSRIIGDHYLSE
ncbi:hypothetical protein ACFE04_019431 [Oxalis oulophora]